MAIQVTEGRSIQNPRVAVSSRLPALDQAMLDAVAKLGKHLNPGKRDGLLVRCVYHLPVEFAAPNRPGRRVANL